MSRFIHSSLRTRLLLLVLLAAGPGFVLTFHESWREHQEARRRMRQDARHLTRLIATGEREILSGTRKVLEVLSHSEIVRGHDAGKCEALLRQLLKDSKRYANLGVIEHDGTVFASAVEMDRPMNAGDRPWFQEALSDNEFIVGHSHMGRMTRRPVVPCAYPVHIDEGPPQRVVFASLDVMWLSRYETVMRHNLPEQSILMKTDQEGTILARAPDADKWIGRTVAPPLLAAIRTGKTEVVDARLHDDTSRLYAITPVDTPLSDTQFYLIIGIPTHIALADVGDDFIRDLTVASIAFLILLAVAWFAGQRLLTRPVGRLADAADKLAEGDLSARVRPLHARGELATLAQAFNHMAEKLESSYSELKAQHEALRASEANYRAIFHAVNDAITVFDAQTGTAIDVNCRLCEMYRITPEQARRMTVGELSSNIPPYTQATADEYIRAAASDGPQLFEWNARDAKGRLFWTEVNLRRAVIGDRDCVLAIIREITERKRSEQRLREERDFNQTLVQSAPAFFVAIAPDGKTMLMNDAMLQALGYQADEVENRDYLSTFVPPAERDTVANVMRSLIDRGTDTCNENGVLTREGRVLQVEWQGRAIRDSNGDLSFFFGFGIDVTERRRLEREESQLREQLHEAQKMEIVGQLAAGVSHDFNNLLTVILASTEHLGTMHIDESCFRKDLDLIAEAADQATGVTRSLLTFSRHVPARKRAVNLRQTVAAAARLVQRVLPASVRLEIESPGTDPLWVQADDTQLQQVLLNLAVNARDAMPKGGTLTIAVESRKAVTGGEHVARIQVRDTGVGIPPELHGQIFRPFFTTKPAQQGTGLGLAIARSIVTDHGGRIGVDSRPGCGTTFTVDLPEITDGAAADGEQHRALPAGNGELILIAEDDTYVSDVLAHTLKSLGYRTVEVSDGNAVQSVHEENASEVRLGIIDVDLPGRSGLECVRAIRRTAPHLPIILTTGRVEENVAAALDDNTRLLPKPFRATELAAMIARILAGEKE